MKNQYTLMKYCPATRSEKPYPSEAKQWRAYHGNDAWLYNPWTGKLRHYSDIGTDVYGNLIMPDGEPIYTNNPNKEN